MLKSLYIQNYTLIEDLQVDFDKGFNVITGETGAGKSIIIDALLLLLGDRASPDLIRTGENKAVIEAKFELKTQNPLLSKLADEGFDIFDNNVILRRELSSNGKSRTFLNDTPVQLNQLKDFGTDLVDFHGQHDHQTLLRPEKHLDFLDSVGNYSSLLDDFSKIWKEVKLKQSNLRTLIESENSIKEKTEYLKLKLDEIEKIFPKENEDEELENELSKIENSELIFQNCNDITNLLSSSDDSVRKKLLEARNTLLKLSEIDNTFETYKDEIQSSLISVDEVSCFAENYKDNFEYDPVRIEEIRERLGKLKSLQKKYGTISNIITQKNEIIAELDKFENFELEISNLKNEIAKLKVSATQIAVEITSERLKNSKVISKLIEDTLKELGIQNASFNVNIDRIVTDKEDDSLHLAEKNFKVIKNGIDKVEFMISANIGEELKPLSSIASGGEISRVMLSIKKVLAEKGDLPTLIFDEIDTGISGRIARKVGMAMKELSQNHQIIAITHLPQIASLGERNFSVNKLESNGKTKIDISVLDKEDKIIEVAKLLGGNNISESVLETANELIEKL